MNTRIQQSKIIFASAAFAVASIVALAGIALPQTASAHLGPHDDRALDGGSHYHRDAIHYNSRRTNGKIRAHWYHTSRRTIGGYFICLVPKHAKCGDPGSIQKHIKMKRVGSPAYTFTGLDNNIEYRFEQKADLKHGHTGALWVEPAFPRYQLTPAEIAEIERQKAAKIAAAKKRKVELGKTAEELRVKYHKTANLRRETATKIREAKENGESESVVARLERQLQNRRRQEDIDWHRYRRARDEWEDFVVPEE